MSIPVFVGIDVSKAQVDVALRPEGRFSAPNDESGIAQIIERLSAVPPALVVVEATGGFLKAPAGEGVGGRLEVGVVEARHVRGPAQGASGLAETDALG